MNTVTLTTTGTQGPNLNHLDVEAARADGRVARAWGNAFITADNGYILYINGEQVGAGGAGLPADDPNYEPDGWVRTDHYGKDMEKHPCGSFFFFFCKREIRVQLSCELGIACSALRAGHVSAIRILRSLQHPDLLRG